MAERQPSCADQQLHVASDFDPGFPPPGTAPWSLTTNLDWLRAALEAAGDSDSLPSPPPKDFSFGKVKKNKRKGTAKLTVKVPGPGELELAKTQEGQGRR